MKLLVAVLLFPLAVFSQCEFTALSLPFSETLCYDDGDCNFVQNIYPISHPIYGCWTCLNNPTYYVITPSVDTYVVLDIYPTLYSHLPSNTQPQVAGFILFDGCPNNGGETLFRPWSYSNGACWNWSVLDVYCGWSQSTLAPNLNQGCVTSTPFYSGMAHEVTMGFELEANTEYWFCIFPQGGCPPFTNSCTWGCIDVSFSGLSFLELLPALPEAAQESPTVIKYPRKIYHPAHGVIIEISAGFYVNILFQEITFTQWQ
jgi:hypothetical protein